MNRENLKKVSMDQKLEDIGSKTERLISKKAREYEPKILKLMDAFSSWLDTKLKG